MESGTPRDKRQILPVLGGDLGIDLGTANTRILMRGRGIVLRERTVVAYDRVSRQVVAVGRLAWEMIGRAPERISLVKPLQEGVVADFDTTRVLLSHFMGRAAGRLTLHRPRVVLSIPYGSNEVHRRAVMEAARQAGAREVCLVDEPVAATLGANLPAREAVGNLVVQLGAGTVQVAVVALGSVVRGGLSPHGGDSFDRAIQAYIHRTRHIEIGERMAEVAKMEGSYACDPPETDTVEVKGISLLSGLPVSAILTARELCEAIRDPLRAVVNTVRRILEQTPPQLAADVSKNGIYLTGGGALLKHLDRLLTRECHAPIHIAPQPQDCVVRGTGQVLQSLSRENRLQIYRA